MKKTKTSSLESPCKQEIHRKLQSLQQKDEHKSHNILRLWQYVLSEMLRGAESPETTRYPMVFLMSYYHRKQ